jgi:two-component system, NarL family, sensor histidine kinase UhpB
MTALRLQLEILFALCQGHPAQLAEVVKAQALAQTLDRGLHDWVWQLRSAALPQGDFAVALASFVSTWSEQFGIAAECTVSNDAAGPLSRRAAAHLYAITHEALHNVVKHARATKVNVSVSRRGDRAVLLVEDDGCGFTPPCDRVDAVSGAGLLTMRERAQLAGGDMTIESASGSGTTIWVVVPLNVTSVQSRTGSFGIET